MVKASWSQRHEVEQHSRAALQLHTIFSSCVQCTIEFVTRTLQLCTIFSSCVQCKREFVTRTLRRAALTSRTTSMYTERARRLTSTHPATLSRISTWLSLAYYSFRSSIGRNSSASLSKVCSSMRYILRKNPRRLRSTLCSSHTKRRGSWIDCRTLGPDT